MGNIMKGSGGANAATQDALLEDEYEPEYTFKANQGVPSCFACERHITTVGQDQIQVKRSIPFQRASTNLLVADTSLVTVTTNDMSIPTLLGQCWQALLLFIIFIVAGKFVDELEKLVTVGAIGIPVTILYVIWLNYGAVVSFAGTPCPPPPPLAAAAAARRRRPPPAILHPPLTVRSRHRPTPIRSPRAPGDLTAKPYSFPFRPSGSSTAWAKIPPNMRKPLIQSFVDQKNRNKTNTGAQPVVIKATSRIGPMITAMSSITVNEHHVHVLNEGGYLTPCGNPESQEEMAFAISDIDWIHCMSGDAAGDWKGAITLGALIGWRVYTPAITPGCNAQTFSPAVAITCKALTLTGETLCNANPLCLWSEKAVDDNLQTTIIVALVVALLWFIITSVRSGAPVVFGLKGGAKCCTIINHVKERRALTSLINARQLGRAPQEEQALQSWKGGSGGDKEKSWKEVQLFPQTLEYNDLSAGCCGCCCVGELSSWNVLLSKVHSIQTAYKGKPSWLAWALLWFVAWIYFQFVDDGKTLDEYTPALLGLAVICFIAFYCSKRTFMYVGLYEANFGGLQTNTFIEMKSLESSLNSMLKTIRDQQKLNLNGGVPSNGGGGVVSNQPGQ